MTALHQALSRSVRAVAVWGILALGWLPLACDGGNAKDFGGGLVGGGAQGGAGSSAMGWRGPTVASCHPPMPSGPSSHSIETIWSEKLVPKPGLAIFERALT